MATYVTSGRTGNGTVDTTISMELSSSISEGDLIVIGVGHRGDLTTPSGFYRIEPTVDYSGSGATQYSTILWKYADATDAGKTLVLTQSTSSRIFAMYVVFTDISGLWPETVVTDKDSAPVVLTIPELTGENVVVATAGWISSGSWTNIDGTNINKVTEPSDHDNRLFTGYNVHNSGSSTYNISISSSIGGGGQGGLAVVFNADGEEPPPLGGDPVLARLSQGALQIALQETPTSRIAQLGVQVAISLTPENSPPALSQIAAVVAVRKRNRRLVITTD